jgi:hypothetical protein
MNKRLIFIVLILVAIVLPTIAIAEVQSLPAQKQNTCVLIEQTCSNCTYVNLDAVKYPNSTRAYINIAMTNEGYGWTYSFCDTSKLGTYIVTTCGDVDGILTCVNYDFDVTPDGVPYSSNRSSTTGYILLFLMVVFIIFIILTFTTKNIYVGFIGGFFALVFLLFAIQTLLFMPQIAVLESFKSMFGIMYYIVITVFFLFIFGFAVYMFIYVFQWDKIAKQKKLSKWGLLDDSEF